MAPSSSVANSTIAVVTVTATAAIIFSLFQIRSFRNIGQKLCDNGNNSQAVTSNNTTTTNDNDLSWQQRSTGVARSRFRAKQTDVNVVCAPTTSEYLKCINHIIERNDSVLILCGTTADNGGVASAISAACGGKNPCVYCGDAWDVTALRSAVAKSNNDICSRRSSGDDDDDDDAITVICIDGTNIHGNDIFADTVVLVRYLRSVFKHSLKTVIVKSRIASRHARSFHAYENFMNIGGMDGLISANASSSDGPQVVCAVGVENYRQTIPFVVKKGDRLLEIGCHHGKTTFMLANASVSETNNDVGGEKKTELSDPTTTNNSRVFGIDIGKVCIDRAYKEQKKRQEALLKKDPKKNLIHNDCHFEVADAWDTRSLQKLDPNLDAIYVDVGGVSGSDGVFEGLTLIRQLISAYSSTVRCIVVKSRCLRDHAKMWQHSDSVLRRK